MRRTERLLAASALTLGTTMASAAVTQQFGTLHTVSGHTFRPERVDATAERRDTLQVPDGFQLDVFAEEGPDE